MQFPAPGMEYMYVRKYRHIDRPGRSVPINGKCPKTPKTFFLVPIMSAKRGQGAGFSSTYCGVFHIVHLSALHK